MVRRTILGALLIGLISTICMTCAAADEDKTTARVVGQLTKIEGKTLTIVPVEGQATVIFCTDATKISRENDKVQLKFEDLQVGQQVRAYYNKNDNSIIGIFIDSPPPATPAP